MRIKGKINILLAVTLFAMLLSLTVTAQFNPSLLGNAFAQGNNCFTVTPNTLNQSGAIWSPDQIDMNADFVIEFRIFLGTNDANGADGLTFVIKNNPTPLIGNVGGGMGYEGIANSIAVEFDTYQNNVLSDPFFDHIAIVSGGNNFHTSAQNLAGPIVASATSNNIEDGQEHDVRIEWNAATTTMSIFFDCNLRLSYTGDLINQVFAGSNITYFGFTGSTGGLANLQSLCFDYISFATDVGTLDDRAICIGGNVTDVDATINGAVGYLWTPVTGVSNPAIANPVFSPSSTTTYTVDITNGCGNNIQEDFTITVVSTPPTANPVADLAVCDDASNDGIINYDLSTLDASVLGTQDPTLFDVIYYTSQADADTQMNPLPLNFTNTAACTRIYARIESVTSASCYDTTDFELCVSPQPVAHPVATYRLCDDPSNNNSEVFDLVSRNPEILLTQNPADFNIEYFTSPADADLGSVGGATPVSNLYSSAGQIMYARIENNANTDCFDTTSFDIIVDDLPLATAPADLIICDDASNDGTEDIALSQFDTTILNGQTTPTFVVSYHLNQADADADAPGLTSPFTITTGTTTIVARIDNSDNQTCFDTTPINIILNEQPVAHTVAEYRLCDTGNDGVEDFDLSSRDTEVLLTQNPANFNIEYFTSQADADLGSAGGASPLPTSYNSSGETVFVRIETAANATCYNTTSFNLVVDDLPLATAPADLIICDDASNDGTEDIALSQFDTTILNGQTTPTFVVSYHLNQADADADAPGLTSPFNITTGTTTIVARIDNSDNQTCFDTTAINIILNEQALANPVSEYRLCDTGNDGVEDFDLSSRDTEVLLTQNPANFNIEYFTSQADADLGSAGGASPLPTSYNSSGETVFVRIETAANATCYNTTSFNLVVDDLPLATTPADLIICDDASNDGTEDIALSQFDAAVLNGQTTSTFVVSYHLNQADADADAPGLTSPFNITTGTTTIVARIDNTDNQTCYNTTPITIILNEQAVANNVAEYRICDDASNDGVEDFDLSTQDSQVLGTQNAANFTIAYFTSQADADLGSTGGATPLPTIYNSGSATLFVRIQTNANNSCYDTAVIDLFVDPLPLAGTPADIIVCDDPSNDGTEDVDLSQFDSAILDGQTNPSFNVTYHASQADANANASPLSSPYAVTSTTPNLFARIDNADNDSCYTTTTFRFVISPTPTANSVLDMITCDDPGNDGSEVFDLSMANSQVLNGQNSSDFNITFHPSQNDANMNTAALATSYASDSITPETIFVRIEAISNPVCFDTTSFTLTVSEQPTAGTGTDVVGCDDISNDGFEEFDFSTQDAAIYNGQSTTDFNVTYHSNATDADNDVNALSFPYTNTSRTQTIYARIENAAHQDCYDLSTFRIEVFARPVIADQGPYTICAGVAETIDAGPGFSSYLWSTGETTQTIDVASGGDYTVTVTNSDGCDSTATVTVVESDVAVIERIDVGQFEVNTNTLTAIVTGSGDYEFSLDDFVYQDSQRFNNLYPGFYTIYVKDKNGCGTVSMSAVIIGGPPYFTPNQDGYHDTWQVIAVETIPDASIYIFDRHGKLLKQVSATGRGWDGTYNGAPMPSSDYWYLVELADGRSFKGHFALKR
uniref:lectin-like domain-containing protein n=1 Tax=Nonlabens sp. Ci31 TaxID=2608253 RepID=UPI001475F775|nr:T9SS type B sorting domain-containing protein [Nonlabens sp. Ci31]